jgi:hypothetical protein
MVHIQWVLNTHDWGPKKFIILKKGKSGRVAFGNDSSVKILGKGVVSLGSKNVKAKSVLLVE